MYYQAILQITQALKTLEVLLDKAQRYADEKNFDINVLMEGRLAPDMKPLVYQIQSACDYVKAGAAWLSGQKPPVHEDSEQTIDEVRARIQKTVDFAQSVTADQYANASEQKVKLSWAPGKVIEGQVYLFQVTIPNVYFHICMVYAILRQNGVNVGKMDFLGQIDFVNA
ncbi:DUF1993 domain-containing protein (plasmid) [Paraburkholderia strydomiana]